VTVERPGATVTFLPSRARRNIRLMKLHLLTHPAGPAASARRPATKRHGYRALSNGTRQCQFGAAAVD
jgi:hypothetical protein